MPKTIRVILSLILALTAFPVSALTDMNGNATTFKAMLTRDDGKWSIIEIWSSDCSVCPDAVLFLSELVERYSHKTQLTGVSVDGDHGANGLNHAKNFIKKNKVSFPSLYSSSVEVQNFLYELGPDYYGTPTLMIFNPEGELRGVEVGSPIAQDIIDFIEADEMAKN